uniref:Ovule protein n=1 Tax=Haemonchus placei TaxID=6290 RepID=A0A0N4WHX2_HAEPC
LGSVRNSVRCSLFLVFFFPLSIVFSKVDWNQI